MHFADGLKFMGMNMIVWPAGAAASAFGRKVSWPLRVAFAMLALTGIPVFMILVVSFMGALSGVPEPQTSYFAFLATGYVLGFLAYDGLLIRLRGYFFPLMILDSYPVHWCEKCQRRARWMYTTDESVKLQFFCARHAQDIPMPAEGKWCLKLF